MRVAEIEESAKLEEFAESIDICWRITKYYITRRVITINDNDSVQLIFYSGATTAVRFYSKANILISSSRPLIPYYFHFFLSSAESFPSFGRFLLVMKTSGSDL